VSESAFGAVLIALLFLFFAMGLEVSLSLGLVGVLGLLYLKGFTVGLGVVGSIAWSNATSFSFIAVPLFVFMSGILLHSGVGKGLYTAVARWVAFLPGGLAVASIFSCAIFAAISGSSVATAATIGMIAIPEMERRGYYRPFIFGSVAAGGTLGILIPPSIPMIIYGVMTETSIGHLYMAGMIPGAVLAVLFAAFAIGYALIWPEAVPRVAADRGSFLDKLRSFNEVAPVAVLITVVLGSMYAGIVTPTEAAALGSLVSLAGQLLLYFLLPSIIVMTYHYGFAGGLDVQRVWRLATSNVSNSAVAGLVMVVAGIIGVLGIVACCIGVFFTSAYAAAVTVGVASWFERAQALPAGAPPAA